MPFHLDGYSLFDDKGEVKRMVDSVVQRADPAVTIERLRKIDFAYVFILAKGNKRREVELTRQEIDASWNYRSGNVDLGIETRIFRAIAEL